MTKVRAKRHLVVAAVVGVLNPVSTPQAKPHHLADVAVEDAPLNLLIICDASKSGGGANLVSAGPVNHTRAELIRAISRHLTDDDRVRIATFGDRLVLSPTWTRGFDSIWEAFESVARPLGDKSPVWDAIYVFVDAFEGRPGRRVIFLVADGKASGNVHGFDAAVDRARTDNVTVFAANVVSRNSRGEQADQPNHPAARLKRIAQATHGDYAEPVTRSLPAFFGNVVKKLNTSVHSDVVRANWSSDRDGGVHRSDLRVAGRGVTSTHPSQITIPEGRAERSCVR